MALYELDYDEGIVLQSTSVLLGGATEEEFENIDVMELVVTNKRIFYVLEISTGFFSKAKIEVKQVPLSSIKIINGVPQVKQVKHDMWGPSIQVQFVHGVEYWTLDKKIMPEWICEIRRLLVGEAEPAKNTPTPNEDVLTQEQDTKPSVFGAVADVLKDVADTAVQAVSSVVMQTAEEDTPEPAIDDEVFAEAKVEEAPSGFEPQGGYANRFCTNCGNKLAEGAKFCQACGAPVNSVLVKAAEPITQQAEPVQADTRLFEERKEQRKTVYDGEIHKCPNCGDILGAYESVCESCGYERRGIKATSSVQQLALELQKIEYERPTIKIQSIFAQSLSGGQLSKADEQKVSLIKNFAIPNTKEDIIEFAVLASSNIDIKLYGMDGRGVISTSQRAASDAWLAKFEQAYQKAHIMFSNSSEFAVIRNLYEQKMKELSKAKRKPLYTLFVVLGVYFLIVGLILLIIALTGGFG